jgi:3-oxoacyl-(acyl-carrier-protein) synthase
MGIAAHDRAELAGLGAAFGDAFAQLPLAPLKGQISSLGAGCGVDAATAVLALHHGKIPGAANHSKSPGDMKLNIAPNAREAHMGVSVSSVYSLGGQNAALVFRKL